MFTVVVNGSGCGPLARVSNSDSDDIFELDLIPISNFNKRQEMN